MKHSRFLFFALLLMLPAVLNCGSATDSITNGFVENLFDNSSTVDGVGIANPLKITIESDTGKKEVKINVPVRGTDKKNAKVHAKIYTEAYPEETILVNEFDITTISQPGVVYHYTGYWDGKKSDGNPAPKGKYKVLVKISGKNTKKENVKVEDLKEFDLTF